jgi:hypothetical protein
MKKPRGAFAGQGTLNGATDDGSPQRHAVIEVRSVLYGDDGGYVGRLHESSTCVV